MVTDPFCPQQQGHGGDALPREKLEPEVWRLPLQSWERPRGRLGRGQEEAAPAERAEALFRGLGMNPMYKFRLAA